MKHQKKKKVRRRDEKPRKQKVTEEALIESERKFREIFDGAPVGYHELDTEGRIVRVNRTELDMPGYTAEEMLGQPVWKFIVEEKTSHQAVLEKITGVDSSLQPFERTYRRKDGTAVPVLIQDRILRERGGESLGFAQPSRTLPTLSRQRKRSGGSRKSLSNGWLSERQNWRPPIENFKMKLLFGSKRKKSWRNSGNFLKPS